ncbi:hypothetical protein [Litorimonas sp. WD9-15]|uniref:hypothetical protein n=1 Tax=Litorimonas sp. WD9-15 TaxID=3418716 RepID=UPI003D0496FD
MFILAPSLAWLMFFNQANSSLHRVSPILNNNTYKTVEGCFEEHITGTHRRSITIEGKTFSYRVKGNLNIGQFDNNSWQGDRDLIDGDVVKVDYKGNEILRVFKLERKTSKTLHNCHH